jgi:hypothetical protein
LGMQILPDLFAVLSKIEEAPLLSFLTNLIFKEFFYRQVSRIKSFPWLAAPCCSLTGVLFTSRPTEAYIPRSAGAGVASGLVPPNLMFKCYVVLGSLGALVS